MTSQTNQGSKSSDVVCSPLDAWKKEEDAVLRECLFILQGLSGDGRLSWNKTSMTRIMHPQHLLADETLNMSSPVLIEDTTALLPASWVAQSRLGSGFKDTLSFCSEAGWLYRRIQLYIDSVLQTTTSSSNNNNNSSSDLPCASGSIARAFACALKLELNEYLQFLTQLEQDIDRIHLRQVRVRLRGPTQRLQTLAMLTDSLQHLSGGPLLAALWLHTVRSGDARHVAITNRLLSAASKPWYRMLHQWTTEGLLLDPAREFFVRPASSSQDPILMTDNTDPVTMTDLDRYNATAFEWNDGFVLEKANLPGPGLMDDDLVGTAFRVGKGINFVRKCMMDGEWTFGAEYIERTRECFCYTPVETTSSTSNNDSGKKSGKLFRSALTEGMRTVHKHILDSLHHDHHLMLHLYALKQFMLLGQGDFYSALMEGLSAEFGGQVGLSGIHRYTLASIVETALRSTNANNFPPHILERVAIDADVGSNGFIYSLDSSFMAPDNSNNKTTTENDTRTIWDIFGLDYVIPETMAPIVDEDAKKDYQRVFRFVFGLRTVEHHLNSTWRTSATLHHALHAVAQQNSITVAKSQSYARAIALLRQIAMTRQAMVHFVVNFKSYIMFEILEGGWKYLLEDIRKAETLDDIAVAHATYLRGICRKCLLGKGETTNRTAADDDDDGAVTGAAAGGDGDLKLGDLIAELLELCGEFCDYQTQVFEAALGAAERAKEKRREALERAKDGDWAFEDSRIPSEEQTFLGLADSVKLGDLSALSDIFHNKMAELIMCADDALNGVSLAPRTPNVVNPVTPRNNNNQQQLHNPARHSSRIDDALASLRFFTFQLDQNSYYESNHQTN